MRALTSLALVLAAIAPAAAAPLAVSRITVEWRVYNPFRFFKHDRDFLTHRDAFQKIVAANGGRTPLDIIERMEGALNPGICPSGSDFDACRLGWAAKSWGEDNSCYGRVDGGAFGYAATCLRDVDANGARREDYVSPDTHSIEATLSGGESGATCQWRFRPVGAAPRKPDSAPCSSLYVVEEVPASGGTLDALDTQGHVLARATILVQDWLVVGLGDSYASGEGNPDRPVTLNDDILSAFTEPSLGQNSGLPARKTPDPIPFDTSGQIIDAPAQREYYDARARWTSPDCHRSQYSHQFRVALQLAIEHPHSAVTLIHLACSGADTLNGVFRPMPARELNTSADGDVRAEFDQALDLLCASQRSVKVPYHMQEPVTYGDPTLRDADGTVASCAKLKRRVDLALLSLGGNDVGFSGLVAYGISQSDADFAPIADLSRLIGRSALRFPPQYGYLPMLRGRLRATAAALGALLQLPAKSVVQTDYEDLVVDENGATCRDATGLDALPKLRFDLDRTREVETYAIGDRKRGLPGLFDTLRCSANAAKCGPGWDHPTGFRFVSTQDAFKNRGICAVKDQAESRAARLTRLDQDGSAFTPYRPGEALPYASRQRLFVTINDAFLRSNTQIDWPGCSVGQFCPPIQDFVQIASSGLYGGAFHRNAEGHAVVADQVMNQYVRAMFAGR